MTSLVFIDILAALFVVAGFQLAFRQKAIRAWVQSRNGRREATPKAERDDPDSLDSVWRMTGVMIMAFSVTGCAFANLLAYYAAQSAN